MTHIVIVSSQLLDLKTVVQLCRMRKAGSGKAMSWAQKRFLKVEWGKTHVVHDLKVKHGCSIDVGGVDMSVSMLQNIEGRKN